MTDSAVQKSPPLPVLRERARGEGLQRADWLAANGQPDRAEWIRASCEFAPLSFTDPRWNPVGDQVRNFWNRCRPAWWEELTGVNQKNDRGMFRFILGDSRSGRSIAPLKRIKKAAWLGQAMDEGWLLRVEA